jgi:hypothetical protein
MRAPFVVNVKRFRRPKMSGQFPLQIAPTQE